MQPAPDLLQTQIKPCKQSSPGGCPLTKDRWSCETWGLREVEEFFVGSARSPFRGFGHPIPRSTGNMHTYPATAVGFGVRSVLHQQQRAATDPSPLYREKDHQDSSWVAIISLKKNTAACRGRAGTGRYDNSLKILVYVFRTFGFYTCVVQNTPYVCFGTWPVTVPSQVWPVSPTRVM